MATVGYELTRDDLKTRVSEFVGYGRTVPSGSEGNVVDELVDEGLRQFYFAPGVDRWSFLSPTDQILLWYSKTATATVVSAYQATGSELTDITVSASTFDESFVGSTITFDTTGNAYQIVTYTSATQVSVQGDASAESGTDSLTITTGGDYLLPADFGSLDGPPTFFAENIGWTPLDVVGEQRIRYRRQFAYGTSRPLEVAIRPVPIASAATQRMEMMVWPIPDESYRMAYRYSILPTQLGASDYPLGGRAHTQTILESCLACAERRIHDEAGIHTKAFEVHLAQSIKYDERFLGPEYIGNMNVAWSHTGRDLSDVRHRALKTDVTVSGLG